MTTKIEWTDETWNPVTGCTVKSDGCKNCYAMTLAGTRLKNHPSRAGLTRQNADGKHIWTGEVRFNEAWIRQPLQWKKPRMIFVCAHGDLFHEDVPDEWIDRVFAVMALAPHHIFQILTKRPNRMREYLCGLDDAVAQWERVGDAAAVLVGNSGYNLAGEREWPLANVWLGVSVEDQQTASDRILDLIRSPAAVHWLSCEPLLGPIDFDDLWWWRDVKDASGDIIDYEAAIDWIVVGGESGPGARPMHPDWARQIRDQCDAANVPFFFKQWGEYVPPIDKVDKSPVPNMNLHAWVCKDGSVICPPDCAGYEKMYEAEDQYGPDYYRLMVKVGKKMAGRELDGRTHDAFPKVAS